MVNESGETGLDSPSAVSNTHASDPIRPQVLRGKPRDVHECHSHRVETSLAAMRGATNKRHIPQIRSLGSQKKSIVSDEDKSTVDAVPTMHCSRRMSNSQGTGFPPQVVDQTLKSAK